MIVFETKIQFAQNQKHSLLLQYRCAFQIKPFRTSAKTAYPSHGAVFHCSNVDGDITSLAILFGFLGWRHSCGLLVLVRHHGKALSLQSRHVGGGRGSSSHTDRPSHLVARRSATSVFHAEKAFSDVRSCSVAAIPACNWRTRRGGTIQRHDCILSQSTDIKQSITLMICSG